MEIIPLFFGFIGTLLTIIFLASVWIWMRSSEALDEKMRKTAKWNILGFALFLMAAWFTCGIFSYPGFVLRPERANYEYAATIMYVVMITLLIASIFMFLGQRNVSVIKVHKGNNSAHTTLFS